MTVPSLRTAASSTAPNGPTDPAAVSELLDETSATRLLRNAGLSIIRARPEYLRHKPGETSIVSFRFDLPGSTTEGRGYAHWCAQPERADEIHRKALTLRPRLAAVGVSTIRVDDHTVFYGFPNDARLRRLRWYTTPRKLKHSLAPLVASGEEISKTASKSTVLKYKPERRLVARVDLATADGRHQRLLVRYTTGRDAIRLAAIADALRGRGVPTPTPRAQLEAGRVGVDEFIEGTELRTWLLRHRSVAHDLGTSLLGLHATEPPPGTTLRTADDDLANAINGLLVLSLWDRDLASPARSLARRLTLCQPHKPGATGLIHGDLHDKNILVNDDRAWFIDLERAAVGVPASDLGRLRAHAISLDIRQPGWSPTSRSHAEDVIDCYRSQTSQRRNADLDDQALGWHCAIALVDQALLVTRHVEDGWRANAEALLAAAVAVLRPRTTRTDTQRGVTSS